MKKLKYFSALFALIVLFFSSSVFGDGNVAQLPAPSMSDATPVGYWKQYDDHTGQLESILQISEKNGALIATPLQAFPINGQQPDTYCTKCSGSLHNAKIVGMTVMWDMKQQSPTQWGGGHIVDPKNGKIYRCEMTLINGGQRLKVRGYIGIFLLGRSQVWQRTTK